MTRGSLLGTGRFMLLMLTMAGCADERADGVTTPESEEVGTQEAPELGPYPTESRDKIMNGTPVTGAGGNQQWEGIVHLEAGGSWCSGFFITDRHILTSAHCFDQSGPTTLKYRAPTLIGFNWVEQPVTVTRNPKYSGSGNRSDDVAVIRLDGWAEPWADASRRFRLYTGSTTIDTMLHLYGYGHDGNGSIGTLRSAPNRATIRIVDHENGYFEANAHTARHCGGDSGGPAIKEGAYAIVWGVTKGSKTGAFESRSGGCPTPDDDMFYTKVNYNMAFIESVLGFSCARYTGDGQTYARCW